jgi:hypothetical protein
LLAELARVAVGDERQGAEVVVWFSGGLAFYAEDLGGLRGLDYVGDFGFDDCDVGRGARGGAELGDEAPVVEGAAFGWSRGGCVGGDGGVGDGDGFVVVGDLVAVARDCVDVL